MTITPSPELQSALNRIWRSIEGDEMKRESARAKADPQAHKLTRVMEGKHGSSYRYRSAGTDGLGRRVLFCWSVHRNAAGYFLGWREVYSKPRGKRGAYTVKRDRWVARKAKWRARDVAVRRAASFLESMACPVCNHPGGKPTRRRACPGCGAVEVEDRRRDRNPVPPIAKPEGGAIES
jgi:hypothetical protein